MTNPNESVEIIKLSVLILANVDVGFGLPRKQRLLEDGEFHWLVKQQVFLQQPWLKGLKSLMTLAPLRIEFVAKEEEERKPRNKSTC